MNYTDVIFQPSNKRITSSYSAFFKMIYSNANLGSTVIRLL